MTARWRWCSYSGTDVGTYFICLFFFFNDTATTEIYTLSLHDALPIYTHPNLSQAFGVDFNNDSYVDIVAVDGLNQNDDVFWFQSDDSGNLGTETSITDNQLHNQIYGFTINDFDFDGDLDIATIGYQDGKLKWIENQLDLLGIDDNSLETMSIYPNPTTDKLYFKSTLNENFKVSIFDILGKKVIEKSLNINEALDVTQLHTGIYIIRFDDYNNTFKFVKE